MIKYIKINILSILLLFVITTSSFSCNYRIANFGAKPDAIKLDPPPITFPDAFGGKTMVIPLEAICPNETNLLGSTVNLLFVDDQMISLKLERANQNDKKLMDLAMKQFGTFAIPESVDKKNWRGTYTWDKPNEFIMYSSFNIPQGEVEIIKIENKQYMKQFIEYEKKIEEWLNSQK